jgi:hypothetical protein
MRMRCPTFLADAAQRLESGSAEKLGWLVEEQRIERHIPVFDKLACICGG